jgi:S1-C subfamily serine protease
MLTRLHRSRALKVAAALLLLDRPRPPPSQEIRMRSSRALWVVAWLLALVPVLPRPAVAADPNAEAVFRAARAYTVRIRTRIDRPFLGDEQGSFTGAGFLVDAKRGWIVTNAHVVGQSPSDVQVAFADEPYRHARRLYVDSYSDIAVLTLGAPVNRPTARLDGPAAVVGEAIGAYGHPLGIPFNATRGIVSCHTDQEGTDLIQIDATVDHGNSGGPVIALRGGRVIGIATSGAGKDDRERLNFATPIGDVRTILAVLERGGSPSPAQLGFAFLKDDEEHTTMNVACTFDSVRWPFAPGDKVVAIDGAAAPPRTLDEFMNALRGRTGPVRMTVERNGKRVVVETHPTRRPAIVDRRGISIDGALIAPLEFEDDHLLGGSGLAVHSVEPSSAAQILGLEGLDMLVRVDGRTITQLDSLVSWMGRRPAGPVVLEYRRFAPGYHRMFEYHRRELPGTEVELIGPEGVKALASR